VIQSQALQDRNVPDKQQWESAVKFMEHVVNQALEHEESQLIVNVKQTSWKKYLGLEHTSQEEKHRQQCVKELNKVLICRQQIDQTMKAHLTVDEIRSNVYSRHVALCSCRLVTFNARF
jgi:broad specificity polyphosphatase/5'/3'-nucleotidase SurE